MKQLIYLITLILLVSTAQAQKFGYQNKLINEKVNPEQKSLLVDLIESNCLFNGDMQFLVHENDLEPLPKDYVAEDKSMQDMINHQLKELAEAKTPLDSVSIYLSLKGAYLNMLMFNEAQECLQYSYKTLDLLLNDTELDSTDLADVYRMAGSYMMEYGQDPSSSYPYFTQAILLDPSDTASYVFIMLLYTQYGEFDQADSIAFALEQEFPEALSPYILHTQSVVSRMYVENSENPDALFTTCINDLADLSYLNGLKSYGKGTRQELLYYLLLENTILLKYYLVMGADGEADILDCDRKYLEEIKQAARNHDHEKSRVPKYTTLNAIAWTFALDHEFDSCVYYLDKALVEVRKLDASFTTVTHNILSSKMAFTFLSGDTLGAISVLEYKLSLKDTIGYLLSDIALLSRLYAMTGNYEKSHEYADALLNYNPNFFPAYRIKAYADYMAGKPDSVFTYMDKAAEIAKQNFETYLMYGLLYLLKDKPELAYTYFEAAWYIDPTSSILDDVMLELYMKK